MPGSPTTIETKQLRLVPRTQKEALAQVEQMSGEQRSNVSADWLARAQSASADVWTLGFSLVDRSTGAVVGTCGYTGPPGADETVEIAYGVDPPNEGKGYATEAAGALVAYAFDSGLVAVVRAHTLPQANASTRVLTKCGFRFAGEVVDPVDGLVWRWERTTNTDL